MKLSNFCPKCGKRFLVCLCLTVAGGAPAVEAIISPPEECRISAPCSVGDQWSPHGEEHDYGTNQPAIEPVAETGGAATAASLPPWGWEEANNLPPAYRYPRRSAAFYQSDDGAWMGPLTLRSLSTSP